MPNNKYRISAEEMQKDNGLEGRYDRLVVVAITILMLVMPAIIIAVFDRM